jgi:hypothetical protein
MSDLPQRLPGQLDIDECIELVEAEDGPGFTPRHWPGSAAPRAPRPARKLTVAEVVQQRITNQQEARNARSNHPARP